MKLTLQHIKNRFPRIILASNSSARREILTKAGIEFHVDPADLDEESFKITPHSLLVQTLAQEKAKAVMKRHPNALIIAADTLIISTTGNTSQIIGKPKDSAHAQEILKKLQGTTHLVLTGLSLLNTKTGQHATGVESTKVVFKPVPDTLIGEYVATGEPLGRSGAYAIQGLARAVFLDHLEGDENNVIGLPLNLLCHLFEEILLTFP